MWKHWNYHMSDKFNIFTSLVVNNSLMKLMKTLKKGKLNSSNITLSIIIFGNCEILYQLMLKLKNGYRWRYDQNKQNFCFWKGSTFGVHTLLWFLVISPRRLRYLSKKPFSSQKCDYEINNSSALSVRFKIKLIKRLTIKEFLNILPSYLVTRSQNVLRCLIRNTEVESVRGKFGFFEGDFDTAPPPPLSSETSNFWLFLFGSKFNSQFLLLIFSFSFSISGVWVVIEWDLPHLFL